MSPTKKRQKRESGAADPPEYGRQDYWNARYQSVLLESKISSAASGDNTADTDAPLPYHEWYFTYEELRPILLPLIFGPASSSFLVDEGKPEDTEEAEEMAAVDVNHDGANEGSQEEEMEQASDEEALEEGDVDEDEDGSSCSDEEPVARPGLGHAPITILEVGCGDSPLGAALAAEIWTRRMQMQGSADSPPSTGQAFKGIICSDYSPVVVDVLRKQYTTNSQPDPEPEQSEMEGSSCRICVGQVPLQFEVLDATALPHTSNSVNMVLEKGTMDAVLSDKTDGVRNAIQIMSECARVVMVGGYIVLISHLNAHSPAGLSWLETVVFAGLKKGDALFDWSIEVHGKDEPALDEADDDSENSASPGATGPAVYVISKLPSASETESKRTVPVRFFSY